MNDVDLPPLFKRDGRIIGFLVAIALAIYVLSLCKTDESASAQFYKAKESRRGKLRKAEDKKEAIEYRQERLGISRNIWIEEGKGPRRQFALKAASALAIASKNPKDKITEAKEAQKPNKRALKELYDKPNGWFQEELYWELSDTGEKVMPQGDTWVRQTPPHQKIPERLYIKIVPYQRVRFFDAATGEWDPITNRMTALTTFFSILKVPGHDLPKNDQEGEILARGTATKIIFSFNEHDRKQVACQGVKLHLNQGKSK